MLRNSSSRDRKHGFGLLVAGVLLAAACVAVPAQVEAQAAAQPAGRRHIYSETADPKADIAAALAEATRDHKRVLLDFGGDWCGDCQVLDIYFHREPNATLLNQNFVLVHIFISEEMSKNEKNVRLGEQYGIPIAKGVPALAVLSANGKVLYAQKTGEFEDMRHMNPESVSSFLNQWKKG